MERVRPLQPDFYVRNVVEVARELIGCLLVTRLGGGMIVETEAYQHDEPASHAFRGKTARNASMFGPPGNAYVYLIYGIHHCLNAVCGPEGVGDAVLIRAVEPRDVSDAAGWHRAPVAGLRRARAASGPGKLCAAFEITRDGADGSSLQTGPVLIFPRPDERQPEILTTPRIGISKATELEWRFFVAGNRFVSGRISRAKSPGSQ